MAEQTIVWVGTAKGLHRFESDAGRRRWRMGAPCFPEWRVDAVLTDPADPAHLLIGTSHEAWGPTLRETRDGGESWREICLRDPDAVAEYPLNRIWQLVRAPGAATLYAGVDEAALFASSDGGATWAEVEGLTRHPSRPNWMPGFGGLCLHTILVDPGDHARMWVGISAVGVFGTRDGGLTWEAMNKGLPPMETTGSSDEDAIYCVHKLVLDQADPNRLFLQFHAHDRTPDGQRSCGVFRSDDGGASWTGLDGDWPLGFGFPIGRSREGHLFVMPLVSEENRVFDGGRARIWRSGDGGETWQAFDLAARGEPCYQGVLRDAMAVDDGQPTGVYAGTTGGDLFASADRGETWQRLPARLPRVLCVRAQNYA